MSEDERKRLIKEAKTPPPPEPTRVAKPEPKKAE
jgi:hypothetical protein